VIEDVDLIQSSVVVVGSLNVDSVVPVRTIPAPGQTVLGGRRQTFAGGKGLNQAIAAARAGADVAMVGQVGDDDGGRLLRQSLQDAGVDHSMVGTNTDESSGSAFITVDGRGENAIVVSPGANAALTVDDVEAAADAIAAARVVLVQLEIPLAAVEAALEAATGTVILNPAPAPAPGRALTAEVLNRVDILIPNRSELAAIASAFAPTSVPTTVDEVKSLVGGVDGPKRVIVTLGADGVVVTDGDNVDHIPAPRVQAVDTTGAGDCFCGSLAGRLAQRDSTYDALRYAITAAALSVTKVGASDSTPTAQQVTDAWSRRHI
jgi:ribokinase